MSSSYQEFPEILTSPILFSIGMKLLVLIGVLAFGTTATATHWYRVGGEGRFGFISFRYNSARDTPIIWVLQQIIRTPDRRFPQITIQFRNASNRSDFITRLGSYVERVSVGVNSQSNMVIITASEDILLNPVFETIRFMVPTLLDTPELNIERNFFEARVQNHIVQVLNSDPASPILRIETDEELDTEVASREALAHQTVLGMVFRPGWRPAIGALIIFFNRFEQLLIEAREAQAVIGDVRRLMHSPVRAVSS
jgi:hypothetical protein